MDLGHGETRHEILAPAKPASSVRYSSARVDFLVRGALLTRS